MKSFKTSQKESARRRPRYSPARLLALILALFVPTVSNSQESAKPEKVSAPAFKGKLLSMEVQSPSLGIVLDVSESMRGALPAIMEALRTQMPRNPVLHVDGCGVERPDPRPKIANGMAPETVTAITTLAEHTTATTILWITDMGDPPSKRGVETLVEVLSKHQLQLLLLSVKNKPSPSIRKAIEATEGYWEVIGIQSRG